MLRLLEREIRLPFPASPMTIEIEALIKTYGFNTSFALFWIQELDGKITAAVSKVDSHVTVAAEKDFDSKELKEFLNVIGFSSLLGEKWVLEDLGFKISEKGIIMKYGPLAMTDENNEPMAFACEPPYRKIYNLLREPEAFDESIPSYEDWLCDLSARVRNNCARVLFREREDKCISCGMFTFESDSGAVIGAVATHKDFRSMGYASDIVKELCIAAQKEKKDVFLMCEEGKVSFYKKLEFKIKGEFSLCQGVYNE